MVNRHAALAIEKHLAVAHAALWRAAREAEVGRDQGLCDDLYQLLQEVGRLNVDLIMGKGARRRPVRSRGLRGSPEAPAHGADERPNGV